MKITLHVRSLRDTDQHPLPPDHPEAILRLRSIKLKEKVAVLCGGDSPEREVSLASGRRVAAALEGLGYRVVRGEIEDLNGIVPFLHGVDVAFNLLHGEKGEDGTVQLLLEAMEIPYPGSGPLASSLAMDKPRAREVFIGKGLPVPEGMPYTGEGISEFCSRAVAVLGLPLVLKPGNQGSSVGVEIVHKADRLTAAAAEILDRFGSLLVERYIPGRDLTVGILEQDGSPVALPIVETRPKREFYDYTAKYTPGMTEFLVPAPLPPVVTTRVQEEAVAAHRALGCRGFSRVDFRLGNEDEIPYVLEVNTLPGMTELSDLPMAAAAAGISFPELVEYMLQSAFETEVND